MKNSSSYNPSREEVEKAVMKYFEDGGDIHKIQFNTITNILRLSAYRIIFLICLKSTINC